LAYIINWSTLSAKPNGVMWGIQSCEPISKCAIHVCVQVCARSDSYTFRKLCSILYTGWPKK